MTVREEPRGRSHEPWNLTDLLNALEAAREVSPLPRAGWERTRQVLAFRLLQALAISYLDDGAGPQSPVLTASGRCDQTPVPLPRLESPAHIALPHDPSMASITQKTATLNAACSA